MLYLCFIVRVRVMCRIIMSNMFRCSTKRVIPFSFINLLRSMHKHMENKYRVSIGSRHTASPGKFFFGRTEAGLTLFFLVGYLSHGF